MQAKFVGLHLFAGKSTFIALHPVGSGLCSARSSDEIGTGGRSRAPPLQGPREKVTSIWISSALSIDGNRSKATSCKFGAFVSGGA